MESYSTDVLMWIRCIIDDRSKKQLSTTKQFVTRPKLIKVTAQS